MENLGRQNFEQSWRDVFGGAEGPLPSDSVWLAIDGALTAAENKTNKSRLIFYQRLAATLLLLTTISAMVSYWRWNETSSAEITQETTTSPAEVTPDPATNSAAETAKAAEKKAADGKISNENKGAKTFSNKHLAITTDTSQKQIATNEITVVHDDASDIQRTVSDSTAGDIAGGAQKENVTKDLTAEEEKELVAKLKAQIEETILPEKNKARLDRWLAVGASGGSFTPQASMASGPAAMMDQMSSASAYKGGTAAVKKPTVGTSYSLGVTVGKQLSRKWLLQTGVTYWKQRTDFQSDITQITGNQASAYSFDYASTGTASIALTAPYDVSSTAEFISIPVQAGYVLVDRRIGWILNGGISSDLFLSNTLADKSGQYGAYTQEGGDSKLYRPLSWSGTANTEVNFRLSPRYRIAVVPGIRYSFTNIYNTDSGTSHPLVFDVGLRFRYIFK
jgi:hypothetical protein